MLRFYYYKHCIRYYIIKYNTILLLLGMILIIVKYLKIIIR